MSDLINSLVNNSAMSPTTPSPGGLSDQRQINRTEDVQQSNDEPDDVLRKMMQSRKPSQHSVMQPFGPATAKMAMSIDELANKIASGASLAMPGAPPGGLGAQLPGAGMGLPSQAPPVASATPVQTSMPPPQTAPVAPAAPAAVTTANKPQAPLKTVAPKMPAPKQAADSGYMDTGEFKLPPTPPSGAAWTPGPMSSPGSKTIKSPRPNVIGSATREGIEAIHARAVGPTAPKRFKMPQIGGNAARAAAVVGSAAVGGLGAGYMLRNSRSAEKEAAATPIDELIKVAFPGLFPPSGQMPGMNPYGHPAGAYNNAIRMNPYSRAMGVNGGPGMLMAPHLAYSGLGGMGPYASPQTGGPYASPHQMMPGIGLAGANMMNPSPVTEEQLRQQYQQQVNQIQSLAGQIDPQTGHPYSPADLVRRQNSLAADVRRQLETIRMQPGGGQQGAGAGIGSFASNPNPLAAMGRPGFHGGAMPGFAPGIGGYGGMGMGGPPMPFGGMGGMYGMHPYGGLSPIFGGEPASSAAARNREQLEGVRGQRENQLQQAEQGTGSRVSREQLATMLNRLREEALTTSHSGQESFSVPNPITGNSENISYGNRILGMGGNRNVPLLGWESGDFQRVRNLRQQYEDMANEYSRTQREQTSRAGRVAGGPGREQTLARRQEQLDREEDEERQQQRQLRTQAMRQMYGLNQPGQQAGGMSPMGGANAGGAFMPPQLPPTPPPAAAGAPQAQPAPAAPAAAPPPQPEPLPPNQVAQHPNNMEIQAKGKNQFPSLVDDLVSQVMKIAAPVTVDNTLTSPSYEMAQSMDRGLSPQRAYDRSKQIQEYRKGYEQRGEEIGNLSGTLGGGGLGAIGGLLANRKLTRSLAGSRSGVGSLLGAVHNTLPGKAMMPLMGFNVGGLAGKSIGKTTGRAIGDAHGYAKSRETIPATPPSFVNKMVDKVASEKAAGSPLVQGILRRLGIVGATTGGGALAGGVAAAGSAPYDYLPEAFLRGASTGAMTGAGVGAGAVAGHGAGSVMGGLKNKVIGGMAGGAIGGAAGTAVAQQSGSTAPWMAGKMPLLEQLDAKLRPKTPNPFAS